MRSILLPCILAANALMAGAASAGEYNLIIDKTTVNITGKERPAMTINGSMPGPTLRWKEGEEVTINVTNKLKDDTSIHWHGIILPAAQDGVPGLTFPGIKPGETFTYRFKVKQAGTYWYHSHSGMQEALGMYAPIVIEPKEPEPYHYDREYTVMFSDWLDENPHRVMGNLKKYPGYYNENKRTVADFFRDLSKAESKQDVLADRRAWAQMRMDPTDLADVSGFTFLTNGKTPEQNWTGLFKPGEKVRLRLINASAMSYYDFRIPGLKMTVVQADGQDVEPVTVDEVRIPVAETYDVIVEPENRAYTLFAESFDRTGYARGTLAPREAMSAAVPELRERPLLGMADMGHGSHGEHSAATEPSDHSAHSGMSHGSERSMKDHAGHAGMIHGGGSAHQAHAKEAAPGHGAHTGMNHGSDQPTRGDHSSHGGMDHSKTDAAPAPETDHRGHGSTAHGDHAPAAAAAHAGHRQPMDHSRMAGLDHGTVSGMDHGSMIHGDDHATASGDAVEVLPIRPGFGASGPEVGRSLTYADLRATYPKPDYRAPDREILVRLTGNMERFIWSINDKKFSEAEPVRLQLGERVRIKFVNETMMNHPMHLHGMWMEPVNGQGERAPRKHVINIPPGQTYYADVSVDALGEWAFHCHLMYHMDSGMFRRVVVAEAK